MVATKVLISLCVVGLASAAPQLGVPVQRSGVSEQGIVTNVVSALQPSIAAAVADALRSISLTSTSSNTAFSTGSNAGYDSSRGSAFSAGSTSNTGFASTRGSGFSSGSSSSAASRGSQVAAVKEAPTARPNYAYEFKVADDDELTYITHNEARDGDDVTGVYSYVDPTGALVTVNYQAGAMGYSQTLEKQDGAVDVSTRKASTKKAVAKQTSSATGAVGSTFGSSNSGSAFGSSNSRTISSSSSASNRGSASTFGSNSSFGSSSSLDESALISQIIAALQPQISSAVNGAISNNRQTAVRTVTSNTGFANGSAKRGAVAGDRLTPLFGF